MAFKKADAFVSALILFALAGMPSCEGLVGMGPDASELFDDPDVAALANAAARGDLAAVDQAVAGAWTLTR